MRINFSCLLSLLIAGVFAPLVCCYAQQPSAQPVISENKDCVESLKVCLGGPTAEKTKCLFQISENSPCKGSPLGNLVRLRATLTPERKQEDDPAHLATEPALVDKECLLNFDNQLSSEIIIGSVSSETISQLSQKLEGCKLDAPLDALRP